MRRFLLFVVASVGVSGCAVAAFDDPGPGFQGRTSDPALFRVEQGATLEIDFDAVGSNDFTPGKEQEYYLDSTANTVGTVTRGYDRFSYVAPADFAGTDTFTYITCPGDSLLLTCSHPRTVTITVTATSTTAPPTTDLEYFDPPTTTTTEPASSTTSTSSTSTTTSTTPPPPEF